MADGEWRLMQYAPRDGTTILVYDACLGMVGTAYWGDGVMARGMSPDWYWCWHRTDEPVQGSDCFPDCWMPLPAKPDGL